MSTFVERLEELIGGPRRRSAFARECGIPQSTIRDYAEGTPPSMENVVRIARAKNVPVEWLATGEGPRSIQPVAALVPNGTDQEHGGGGKMRIRRGKIQVEETEEGQRGMVLLPRLSIEASAGQGVVPADEEIEEFLALKSDFLREMGINPQNAHVLMIKGNSMYPTLNDRDVIIVDASVIEALVEGLYTLVLGDAVRAKRLQPLNNGGVRIISDNKNEGYADEVVPPSELHTLKIVGRICGVYRNFS